MYTEAQRKKAQRRNAKKYIKNKLKLIPVRYRNDYFEQVLKPLFDKAGMKPTSYIKKALEEKLSRDFPDEFPVEFVPNDLYERDKSEPAD